MLFFMRLRCLWWAFTFPYAFCLLGCEEKVPADEVVARVSGGYSFVMANREFLVPYGDLKRYGVLAGGARLDNFIISPSILDGSDLKGIDIVVSYDSRSKAEAERYWYRGVYKGLKRRASGWQHEALEDGYDLWVAKDESLPGESDYYFMEREGRIYRMMRCSAALCRISMAYADNLLIYIVIEKGRYGEWLKISDSVSSLVAGYEVSSK